MAFKCVVFAAFVAISQASVLPSVATSVVADSEYDHNPQYSYGYDVQDSITGDSKHQVETRSGDVVRGQYSLVDPDGTRRTVDYTADPVNGFNAVVRKTPLVAAGLPLVAQPAVTSVVARVANPVVAQPAVAPVVARVATPVVAQTAVAPVVARFGAPASNIAHAGNPFAYNTASVAYNAAQVAYNGAPVAYNAAQVAYNGAPVAYNAAQVAYNGAYAAFGPRFGYPAFGSPLGYNQYVSPAVSYGAAKLYNEYVNPFALRGVY